MEAMQTLVGKVERVKLAYEKMITWRNMGVIGRVGLQESEEEDSA